MFFLVAFRKFCAIMPAQRNMASINTSSTRTRVKIYRGERDGVLFYILPPLLLGAVFAFCYMASSENDAAAAAKPAPAAESAAVADEEK